MMNDKMNRLETKSKKVIVAATCCALALGIGGTVFAASNPSNPNSKAEKGNVVITEAGTKSELPADSNKVIVKNENGKVSYSTDGGKTWSSGVPEGAKISKNEDGTDMVRVGTHTVHVGELHKNGAGLAVRNLNGKTSYSTDGGKTWSEKAPAGFTVSTSAMVIK